MIMRDILIKICGMKDPANIEEVVKLKPQYIGFILYHGSPRFVNLSTAVKLAANIPSSIQKTAVLVNEPVENAVKIAQSRTFDLIQLHGNESARYCSELSKHIRVIKAFSISHTLPSNLDEYQNQCEMFLFDNAGEKAGGSGKKFDHSILKNYSLNTEFILSGGINADDSDYIKSVKNEKMSGVDLNSRFEISPGIKDIKLLKSFIEKIRAYDKND
jgi:phosphoribosylanthranilate isomerase